MSKPLQDMTDIGARHLPTQEEIEEETARIREGWGDSVYAQRAGCNLSDPRVEMKVVDAAVMFPKRRGR